MRRCLVGRYSICAKNFSVSGWYYGGRIGNEPGSITWKPLSTRATEETIEIASSTSPNETALPKISSKRPYLPLSPLMDPEYIAAKEKHHLRKPRPPPLEERTAFQQELERSPYARALASPVRNCQVTSVRLPRFFLQDFQLVAHPETNQPWLMPQSLSLSTPETDLNISKQDGAIEENTAGKGVRVGLKSYALSRASLLIDFDNRHGAFHKADKLLTNPFMRKENIFRSKTINVRKDIGALVLKLMRRRVVEALEASAGELVKCSTFENVKSMQDIGAVLWLRGSNQHLAKVEPTDGRPRMNDGIAERFPCVQEPEDFATLDLDPNGGQKLPVHNLQRILGSTQVNALLESFPALAGSEILALRHNESTLDIQMKLWRLHGHVFGVATEDLQAPVQ